MTTPDELERQHTLMTAASRYDALRTQDTLAGMVAAGTPRRAGEAGDNNIGADTGALDQHQALEMLALGELLARKASYGRQLAVRSARAAGASWAQIGAALGTTKQSAWEAHSRWIDEQAAEHGRTGFVGMDPDDTAAARDLAGDPPV